MVETEKQFNKPGIVLMYVVRCTIYNVRCTMYDVRHHNKIKKS